MFGGAVFWVSVWLQRIQGLSVCSRRCLCVSLEDQRDSQTHVVSFPFPLTSAPSKRHPTSMYAFGLRSAPRFIVSTYFLAFIWLSHWWIDFKRLQGGDGSNLPPLGTCSLVDVLVRALNMLVHVFGIVYGVAQCSTASDHNLLRFWTMLTRSILSSRGTTARTVTRVSILPALPWSDTSDIRRVSSTICEPSVRNLQPHDGCLLAMFCNGLH